MEQPLVIVKSAILFQCGSSILVYFVSVSNVFYSCPVSVRVRARACVQNTLQAGIKLNNRYLVHNS